MSRRSVPVTFVDIAVYFSAEEWKNLEEWQKELYNNLVKENYESLLSLALPRSDVQPRLERGDVPCVPEQQDLQQREMPADACAGEAPSQPLGLTPAAPRPYELH
uniref:KRAB domain-containing protein n=1 Tax=Coturnix japonica TaxID=93934 RepID=A0A8C2T667_COTJA